MAKEVREKTKFIQKSIFVRLTFVEPILGATPNDPEIYTRYLGANAPDAKKLSEELEDVGLTDMVDRGTNVFLSDKDGYPYLSNHTILGFFKESCGSIRRIPGKKYKSSSLAAYKARIDTLFRIEPRKIKFFTDGELKGTDDTDIREMIEIYQRPLRASTPQGDRVALASSEKLPEDTMIQFEIQLMDETHEKLVYEWLDYGFYHGIGQWRNGSYGQFEWEPLSEDEYFNSLPARIKLP